MTDLIPGMADKHHMAKTYSFYEYSRAAFRQNVSLIRISFSYSLFVGTEMVFDSENYRGAKEIGFPQKISEKRGRHSG